MTTSIPKHEFKTLSSSTLDSDSQSLDYTRESPVINDNNYMDVILEIKNVQMDIIKILQVIQSDVCNVKHDVKYSINTQKRDIDYHHANTKSTTTANIKDILEKKYYCENDVDRVGNDIQYDLEYPESINKANHRDTIKNSIDGDTEKNDESNENLNDQKDDRESIRSNNDENSIGCKNNSDSTDSEILYETDNKIITSNRTSLSTPLSDDDDNQGSIKLNNLLLQDSVTSNTSISDSKKEISNGDEVMVDSSIHSDNDNDQNSINYDSNNVHSNAKKVDNNKSKSSIVKADAKMMNNGRRNSIGSTYFSRLPFFNNSANITNYDMKENKKNEECENTSINNFDVIENKKNAEESDSDEESSNQFDKNSTTNDTKRNRHNFFSSLMQLKQQSSSSEKELELYRNSLRSLFQITVTCKTGKHASNSDMSNYNNSSTKSILSRSRHHNISLFSNEGNSFQKFALLSIDDDSNDNGLIVNDHDIISVNNKVKCWGNIRNTLSPITLNSNSCSLLDSYPSTLSSDTLIMNTINEDDNRGMDDSSMSDISINDVVVMKQQQAFELFPFCFPYGLEMRILPYVDCINTKRLMIGNAHKLGWYGKQLDRYQIHAVSSIYFVQSV